VIFTANKNLSAQPRFQFPADVILRRLAAVAISRLRD